MGEKGRAGPKEKPESGFDSLRREEEQEHAQTQDESVLEEAEYNEFRPEIHFVSGLWA